MSYFDVFTVRERVGLLVVSVLVVVAIGLGLLFFLAPTEEKYTPDMGPLPDPVQVRMAARAEAVAAVDSVTDSTDTRQKKDANVRRPHDEYIRALERDYFSRPGFDHR